MEWNPSLSVARLPDRIGCFFRDRADFLYSDLSCKKYSGELVELPYTTSHCNQKGISNNSFNPKWYSDFYWANTPHIIGKRGPRRKLGYETLRRSRFEKALGLVAKSKDRDFFKYQTLAREIVMKTLLDGVDVGDEDFSSLIDKVCFEMTIEPNNEVREFFGEKVVPTYRDELIDFQRKYGDERGEVMFFSQYGGGNSFLEDVPF